MSSIISKSRWLIMKMFIHHLLFIMKAFKFPWGTAKLLVSLSQLVNLIWTIMFILLRFMLKVLSLHRILLQREMVLTKAILVHKTHVVILFSTRLSGTMNLIHKLIYLLGLHGTVLPVIKPLVLLLSDGQFILTILSTSTYMTTHTESY